jgi:hypothetical protein
MIRLQSIHPTKQQGNILSVNAGGTFSNNTYRWFRVEDYSSTIIKGDSTFTPTNSGKYYVKVTNAVLRGLTLRSDTIAYTVPAATQNRITAERNKSATGKFSIYPNPAKDLVHVRANGIATLVLS